MAMLVGDLGRGARSRLRGQGVQMPISPRGWIGDPGKSLDEVWRSYVAGLAIRGPSVVTGRGWFQTYKSVRRTLHVQSTPHPEFVLDGFLAIYGTDGVRTRTVRDVLGTHVFEDSFERLSAKVGRDFKRRASMGEREPKDLYGLFDSDLADALRAHLAREVCPPIPPLERCHVHRVLMMKPECMRVMTAVDLVQMHGARLSLSRRRAVLSSAETLVQVLADLDPHDDEAIGAALLQYLEDAAGTVREAGSHRAARDWFVLQDGARALARQLFPGEPSVIDDLLPGCAVPSGRLAELLAGTPVAVRTVKAKRRAARVDRIVRATISLNELLVCVENRVVQLAQLLRACLAKRPDAPRLLDAGLEAGFEWTGRVVLEDGSLGEGEQTVSFAFVRESTLYERALERSPDDVNLRRRFPKGFRGLPGFHGQRHSPETWDRIHVVYEGTMPGSEGGECVEPFFVDLFRSGVFDPDGDMSDELASRRLDLVRSMGLPDYVAPVEGLLGHPVTARACAGFARSDVSMDPGSSDVIVPLMAFYHAMAYARLALRLGVRWGARIGEVLQVRVGCVSWHRRRGRMRPYFEAKPKGWAEMGKFGLDTGTLQAMLDLRALSNARWHGGKRDENGRPWLPELPSGDFSRRDLGEARYIMTNASRAIRKEELTNFARVLLCGVFDLESHDGRRIFATALGLEGVSYDLMGELLHHSPGSDEARTYDYSHEIDGEDAGVSIARTAEVATVGTIL